MTPPESASMPITKTLEAAADLARSHEAFSSAEVEDGALVCKPAACEAEAEYRVEVVDGALFVLWASPDRYLSQSIEADLMWTGDDLDDCIDEELVDAGWKGESLGKLDHFRDERMLYVFRSRIPLDPGGLEGSGGAAAILQCLLAYEAAFRELGDMAGEDE